MIRNSAGSCRKRGTRNSVRINTAYTSSAVMTFSVRISRTVLRSFALSFLHAAQARIP